MWIVNSCSLEHGAPSLRYAMKCSICVKTNNIKIIRESIVLVWKKFLLKRSRNDEDVVERWIDCSKCGNGVHEMFAFANEFSTERENNICPLCADSTVPVQGESVKIARWRRDKRKSMYLAS